MNYSSFKSSAAYPYCCHCRRRKPQSLLKQKRKKKNLQTSSTSVAHSLSLSISLTHSQLHILFQLCFRMERDLMTRTDRFGVEVRERVMWDIREGVVGSDVSKIWWKLSGIWNVTSLLPQTFIPKHVVMITWKNMSFAGGIDNSLFRVSTSKWT